MDYDFYRSQELKQDAAQRLHGKKQDTEAFDFMVQYAKSLQCFGTMHSQPWVSLPREDAAPQDVPVRSSRFRIHLGGVYFERFAQPIPDSLLRRLVRLTEARALFNAARLPITYRLAHRGASCDGQLHSPDTIAIHHGDPEGHLTEITPSGWTVDEHGPFYHFRYTLSMSPLPAPVKAPDGRQPLEELRTLFRLDKRSFLRCLIWLLSVFSPHAPYPILLVRGPSGSGKTMLARLLRSLVDPVTAPFAQQTASERKILAAARDNRVLAWDDIGRPRRTFQHLLKRLTGGLTDYIRARFDDREPATETVGRPILLTQDSSDPIPPVLLDRALVINLPELPANECTPADDLYNEFTRLRPLAFGALCDALQSVLKHYATLHQPEVERLSDLARWSLAAAPSLHVTEEEIQDALTRDPSQEALCVIGFMDGRQTWEGPATDLAAELPIFFAPNQLTRSLRASARDLVRAGLKIEYARLPNRTGDRLLTISRCPIPRPEPPKVTYKLEIIKAPPKSAKNLQTSSEADPDNLPNAPPTPGEAAS